MKSIITEEKLNNIINKLINEAINDKRYKLIGYIKNSNVQYATGNYYVLVDTTVPESDNIKNYFERAIMYNSKEDGSGIVLPHYTELKQFITLLPQYKDSIYQYAIFGKTKENKMQKAKEIIATIDQENGYAILQHNSEKKITDGFIRIGMTANDYSRLDFQNFKAPRAYFWGNGKTQRDVSSTRARYRYFCKLPINQIYPIDEDPNDYKDIPTILDNGYSAITYYMSGNKANGTVIVSFISLPIEYIKDLSDYNKTYNKDWELIAK